MKKQSLEPKLSNPVSITFESYIPLLLLLLFQVFIVFISNSRLSGEDDLFWYLSTGRYIVQTGTVPSFDVFGFTTTGSPWIPFEWGWDVINYYLYSAGGYFALNILSTVLILSIFNLLYLLMKKLKVNNSLSIFLLIILALGICQRFTVKPHLITYLCLVTLLLIITNYRYLKRNEPRVLYLIPFIFIFWVNMHMGVLSGLFMLGIYFISELTGTLFPSSFSQGIVRPLKAKELLRLGAVILISATVVLINPHGIETFKYASHIVSMQQLEKIYEWQSPFSKIYLASISNYFYYFFILLSVLTVYFSFKKRDIFPALISVGYFLYSLSAARLVIDFMIITVTFAAIAASFIMQNIPENIRDKLKLAPPLIVFIILLILVSTTPSNQVYRALGYSRIFGTGYDQSNFPVKMYGFVKSSGLDLIGSKPFNTYETGGHFIWNFPERKNFIGSRGINDEVWNDYEAIINLNTGFEEKIESIGFDYFTWMVPYINYSQNPALLDHGILSYLFRSTEWKLVYWDDISFVFVKDEAKLNEYIKKYEYKHLNPYTFYSDFNKLEKAVSEDKERFSMELDRKQKEDPSGAFTKLMLRYFGTKLK